MLSEAFTYLTTPCDPCLRSMGYLKELIATEARYHRCRTAWAPHLDQTKNVIRTAAGKATAHRKAVVLGAGILCDIPIQFLSETFETVVLVDVCFLRQTRQACKHLSNVEWQVCDLTGVSEQVSKGAVPELPYPLALDLADADLVVSANVLSQLPLVPLDYLRQRTSSISEDDLFKLGAEIVRHHLAHLRTSQGVVCLVTEVERLYLEGEWTTAAEDPLFGVSPDIDGTEWFWDLAPKGEISRDIAVRNRVRGGLLVR